MPLLKPYNVRIKQFFIRRIIRKLFQVCKLRESPCTTRDQIKYPILFQLDWSTKLIVILFSFCLSLLLKRSREEHTKRERERERTQPLFLVTNSVPRLVSSSPFPRFLLHGFTLSRRRNVRSLSRTTEFTNCLPGRRPNEKHGWKRPANLGHSLHVFNPLRVACSFSLSLSVRPHRWRGF